MGAPINASQPTKQAERVYKESMVIAEWMHQLLIRIQAPLSVGEGLQRSCGAGASENQCCWLSVYAESYQPCGLCARGPENGVTTR